MATQDPESHESVPPDQQRFLALLEQHKVQLYRIAAVYAQRAGREDLVQDIVLQLWRSFAGYDGERSFAPWMKRIAINVAFSQLRSRYRRPRTETLDLEVLHVAEQTGAVDAEREQLYNAIAHLADIDRALILLHLDGHPGREIQDILGMSATNVTTRLQRVKERLRRDWQAAGARSEQKSPSTEEPR